MWDTMTDRERERGYTEAQRREAEKEPHMQANNEWLRVVTGKYDRWKSDNSSKTTKKNK